MPILPLAGGSMYLARVRSVPLAGEGLGVGQPPHTGSHRERLHDRANYGKRYKSPWGRQTGPLLRRMRVWNWPYSRGF